MSEATAPFDPPHDVRPMVRTGSYGNLNLWLFGGVLLLAGFLLFQALSARREQLATPQTQAVRTGGGTITAPPPLALPPNFAASSAEPFPDFAVTRIGPAGRSGALPPAQPQVVTRVVERPVAVPTQTFVSSSDATVVPRPSTPFNDDLNPPPTAQPVAAPGAERVIAGRLVNPALTVPKGTVVAAVLETALDSSRAGAARAIVSRDVMGFDGTRVLIPRGSRLYGEYTADVTSGQKRALIRWDRLTRPDGVIVNLDSPSADPLGRAGIEGKVDSHFFARFGSAILQSVLDIGVGLATRSVSDGTVIVGLPGSTQQITAPLQQTAQVQPTLRVRQGTSVSVFVARDLDFSSVDR
jgi:type IV secretion system protein VirB10